MRYGVVVDQFVGSMSRLLHIRGAKDDTTGDLEPYFDLEPAAMFPTPRGVVSAAVGRSFIDRFARSSTVTWPSTHEILCPRYARRHRRLYRKNDTALMRWVRPEGKQRKAALIYVHGWLEPGSWAEETTLFRKWGRELDVDLAHVALPFHGRRKPPSALFSGEFFWTADLVRTVEAVRQGVHDVRCALAWLRAQGYVQIGVTGISLGGAITMLVGCLANPPDYIAPIVAHLHLGDAVEQAPILFRMKKDLEAWGYDEAARREIFRRIGWQAYEPTLAAEKQLWIAARDDVYIQADVAESQWRRWGEPPIVWIEGGHMTFPLHMNTITASMAEFRQGLAR